MTHRLRRCPPTDAPLFDVIAERNPDSTIQLSDGGHLFFLQDSTAWQAVTEFVTG